MKTLEKKNLYKLCWDRLQIFTTQIFLLIHFSVDFFKLSNSLFTYLGRTQQHCSAENYILWSPKLCQH